MGKNHRRPDAAQSKSAPARAKSSSPATVVIAGAVCLAVGLFTGYYFGTQSAVHVPVPSPQGTAPAGSLGSAATFAQDEAGLRAALASNPNDLNALIGLGNLYYDNGRFKDAVDWYGRALALDPGNVNVRTDRGTSYWNLGQADSAIAEFRKSLEINPSHAQTLYNLGVVQLNGKNDPNEARRAWEKLLSTNPNYPERAKVQEQLASLPGPAEAMPTNAPATKSGVEDLIRKMKTRR